MSSGDQEETFVVRIVSLDYYMAKPIPGLDMCHSQLEGTAIERVPVVQIHGATPGGQKTCLHLHKAFPYFYVPYEDAFPCEPAEAQAFLRHIARTLEAAMHAGQESGAQRHQRVFSVQLVRGCPFYGYHPGERLFMKVIMYNPIDVKKAAQLMQGGVVSGRRMQPYEAHLPFLLQIKIDMNLAGMGWLRLSQVHCRVPLPDRHTGRRSGWRDTPTLVQYEQEVPGDTSAASGDTHGSQDKVWTSASMPTQWMVPPVTHGVVSRTLEKRSCCELEVDACVEHVLNRNELVRENLESVGPDKRMVESLAPMWEEERQRCGGTGPPPPPPDPPRDPQELCPTVAAIRAEFQAIADAHSQDSQAAPRSSAQPPLPSQPSPEKQPSADARVCSAGPSSQDSLLRQTQAANRILPVEGSNSPGSDFGPGPAPQSFGNAAASFPGLPEALGGEANTTDGDADLRELLHMLQGEESCSDEEGDGHSRLMELAAAVASQPNAHARLSEALSQMEGTPRAERAASQAQEEVEGILECADTPPRPLTTRSDSPGAANEGLLPGKRQRLGDEDRETGHGWRMADMEDLGGNPHGPMGPYHGRSAVWDGGGPLVAAGGTAVAARGLYRASPERYADIGTPGGQLGVFAGISQESNFDWGAISSVPRGGANSLTQHGGDIYRTPDVLPGGAATEDVVMDSGSEPDLQEGPPYLPQVDGADDVSSDEEQEMQPTVSLGQHASELAATSQEHMQPRQRAGASGSQGSSQRYGFIPLLRASPSTASAPAAVPTSSHANNSRGRRLTSRSRSVATGSAQERSTAPRAARSLQLDASKHSARRGGSAAFRPGAYRQPLGADAGTSRAPFRPPRRLDEPAPMPGFPNAAAATASGRLAVVPRGLGQAAPGAAHPAAAGVQPQVPEPHEALLHASHRRKDSDHMLAGSQASLDVLDEPGEEAASAENSVAGASAGRGRAAVLPQRKAVAMRARRRPIASMAAAPLHHAGSSSTQPADNVSQPLSHPAATHPSLPAVASSAPAAASEPQPSAGGNHLGAAVSSADGTAAERESRRRDSREWLMRVAHESAGIQRAILGSTSSSDQTPQSPHTEPAEPHALSPADLVGSRQPLGALQPASAVGAAAMPGRGGVGSHESEGVISPATKRRESREWLMQVAQQSASLREALAQSSSSEEDVCPEPTPQVTPGRAQASTAQALGSLEAAPALDAAAGISSLQPFGSIVGGGGLAMSGEGGAGLAMGEDAATDRVEVARDDKNADAEQEQSDGPLAAWYALQEAHWCFDADPPSSTTDKSIDVVGIGSQEMTSQHRLALLAAPPADTESSHPTGLDLHVSAKDAAAAEEVSQSQSGQEDIEIDFGSQSLQREGEGREARGDPDTVTKPSQTASAEGAEEQGQIAQPGVSNSQAEGRSTHDSGGTPELQLCLDLSLGSKHTDASASLQPQDLFASANAPQSPERPPSAHQSPDDHAGSQVNVRQDRGGLWQQSQSTPLDVMAMRPRVRPPSQQELEESMLPLGVPAVVHQPAFYGKPEDVPHRPTVWAGLEFRVPSGATSALPPFRAGSRQTGQSAAIAKLHKRQQPSRMYGMTPVQLPPTRAETDEWLAEEREALLASQHSHGSASKGKSGSAGSNKEQAGRAFGMDANTGRLLPGGPGGSGSQESGGSDLLETPALCSMPSQNRRAHGPSRLRIATQQSTDAAGEEQEEEIRPASPKYDERSFFYTTPKLNPARPAFPQSTTPWATPLLLPHPQLAASPSGAASAASPAIHPRQQVPDTPATPAANIRRTLMPPPDFSGTRAPIPGPAPGSADSASHRAAALPATDIRPLIPDAQPPMAPAVANPAEAAGVKEPFQGQKGRAVNPWTSQITAPSPAAGSAGATPLSQAGFRRLVAGKGQNLTLLSIEVHADTRGTLLPDPRYDAVRCIVLAAADDAEDMSSGTCATRVLLLDDKGRGAMDGLSNVQMEVHGSEEALLDALVGAVRALDPDILVGYEVQQGSLGYLNDRATTLARPEPLLRQLSRTPTVSSMVERRNDEYGVLHASGIHVAGRIVLNLWRLLRSELKLRIYTFEACVAAVLQLRTPHIPAWVLSQWFQGGPGGGRWRCVQYIVRRARLSLAMMEQLDITGRTGEMARTFGIDFFSVLTRGSQYRVEAMMARLAHTQNYLLPAPSTEQTKNQPAMEAIPLVMEPESRLYVDPVVVLDFQSLYPSQIIAYNLCFSTCLGRPAHAAAAATPLRLGAQVFGLPKGSLSGAVAPDKLIVAPNGVAYAPPEARQGVLPRLLNEILATRIMVKAAMKRAPKTAKVLQRILNARQFSLKLIANVTYGYTAAGFSGRMPCAELADSIVQSGRETLENTIRMVEAHPEWRARVVYGDTDSLFVLLEGRSRNEAFRIGAEIAAAATAANPPPVTLKMEKVYHPCVLLTKKRYVGYMYETPKQAAPVFDAKGIETVRRDTCSAVAKMLERSLRILFSSKDVSQVKEYVERQWTKILSGRVSLADFVFAKEVRLGTYRAAHGLVPPAAQVASRAMATDPRAEPRYGERVPYVVVHGEPGARLVDMAVAPHALIESGGRLRLHAHYYIIKQIVPALERVFSLLGVDVRGWYAALPRPQRLLPQKRPAAALGLGGRGSAAGTIDAYYLSRHCAVCDGLTHAQRPICEECRGEPQGAAVVLSARAARLTEAQALLVRVCLQCGGGGGRRGTLEAGIVCDSLDCGVFFERKKATGEAAAARVLCDLALQDFE